MGKKKNISDKVRNRKKNRGKPQANPFEVKVNKVKRTVVNKKIQKWEKGAPGVSRSKALKKRKDTLLRELHHMQKSNTLLDKRFGENDENLTADDKMVQRFAIERKKQAHKGDFNLNDEEEVLTHYGQSLAENLQDTLGSDSEDEKDFKTGDLQFGGFSRNGDESSMKEKMNQVIADSKRQKYERQAEKEKTLETTNELDSLWRSVVGKFNMTSLQAPKKTQSAFSQLFNHLVMEQKSVGATDKTKTEEEEAKEEAEKLQNLENDRLARMKGISESLKTVSNHVSADDLCDGFAFNKPKSKVRFAGDPDLEEDDVNGTKDDAEKDDEAPEDDEDESGDEEDDDDDDDGSDDYSDLASEVESEGDDEEDETEATDRTQKSSKSILKNSHVPSNVKQSGKSEIPYIFSAPGSFEELETLLHGHSGEEQSIIISRLRKCHHPSLAEGNKEKLENIHLYLLQYFGKVAAEQPLDKKLIQSLSGHIWESTQTFKAATASALQKYIIQRQAEHVAFVQKRGGRGIFPKLETLMHLSLIENLFPTSDFRHPVTTPTVHFITQLLTECLPRSCKDVIVGIFLCSLALKYVSLSQRYVPEVITFLQGLLSLACQSGEGIKDISVFPPFKLSTKTVMLLAVDGVCNESLQGQWSLSESLSKEKEELDCNQFKCNAVNHIVELMGKCLDMWKELPSSLHIFKPWRNTLNSLPSHLYSKDLKTKVTSLLDVLKEMKQPLIVMKHLDKKPVPLKLFEPKVEEFWAGKKKKGGPNKSANDKQRLTHKYKREMKAAVREIRRDNEVLAKHQLENVMKKDEVRKRKMSDLMHSLADQEGDYKAIKRGGNFKKQKPDV